MKEGGRKSFRIEELQEGYFFTSNRMLLVPYLEMIQKDMDDRENNL